MVFIHLLLYITAFTLIWLGAGFIISSTSRFTERLKLSSFVVSFLILGLLTSTPEFSVGLQSISDNNPGIFVGNLIGGIAVIFLLIIPLFAIMGNGVSVAHQLSKKMLIGTLLVVLAPSIAVLDKRVTNLEGLILIVVYFVLIFFIQRNHGIFDVESSKLLNRKSYSFRDILKIFLGLVLVFISSNMIVSETEYFSTLFNIPVFFVSLLIVSVGTNLPELSLAVRSVFTRKKDVAMGDYLGSAAANTFLFGVLTLFNNGEVITISNFIGTFVFISIALVAFYFFSRTQNFISRKDGFMMLGIYVLFIIYEVTR